jgi:hypothetical protein
MSRPKVFADFHNADAQGRLRLNSVGTVEDLSRRKIVLYEGLPLTVYSEELETDAVAQFSPDEHVWVAVIDWSSIRDQETPSGSRDDEAASRRHSA